MIYRADVIVLAGFNGKHLSDFGPLNHCRDFVLISMAFLPCVVYATLVLRAYFSSLLTSHLVNIFQNTRER